MVGEPDPERDYYDQWARETEKATPDKLLDALQKLATLDAALIGGGLFAFKDGPIQPWFLFAAVALFVASLCAALWGTVFRTHIAVVDPLDVKAHKWAVVRRRARWLALAVRLLVAGFLVALIGLAVKLLSGAHP